MSATVDLRDIPADVRKKLKLSAPRRARTMTINDVRTAAIRVLAVVADLTPQERRRVFLHALKLNEV